MITAVVNGTVVTESSCTKETLILGEGKIRAILGPEEDYEKLYSGCKKLDASGRYVVPGGVDGHVHFGGFGTIPIADDFYTGSRAALAGGTTTIVDFCEPVPGQSPVDCIRQRKKAGEISAVDFALHSTFTEDYRSELPLLPEIAAEGITAFKAFTYYDHTSLRPGDFRTIMEQIHDKGTLLVHAEEKSIIDCMKERYRNTGDDMLPLSLSRPNISEQIAVEQVLAIAKETGTKLCIAHTSTKETVAIKKREEREGNRKFFLETCPHYAAFDRERLKGEKGSLYTMNPPLRSAEDKNALMRALADEDVSILSTDHCPYLKKYKQDHTTYETVPCGVDGIQTRMLFLFSEAVLRRGLSMQAFVRMTSANAAKFYNLYPRKGAIAVGSDADLALFDPDFSRIYSADEIAGATDYSVFEGFPFLGRCTCTVKGGEVVMQDGIVNAEKGSGSFLFTENRDC